MGIRRFLLIVIMIGCTQTMVFADDHNLLDGLQYKGEMQVSATSGDYTPLWLNANKYGLSSLEKSNGYLRASLERPQHVDSARRWGISYGLDMAVAYNYTSTLIIQQAYVDYDGYGSGENWNVKETNKWHRYKMRDMMLGLEVKLKKVNWLNDIVFEYLYTKYQSGPIYHDHTQNISDHLAGADDYYNHYLYAAGWSHWGQAIGNPLYKSPIYQDGVLRFENTRFVAFHLGLAGNPTSALSFVHQGL